MKNFRLEFTVSPWLLLLLIPAIALILAVFWIGKRRRGRCTANRVISAVLQSVVATLCIFAVSGMQFVYERENAHNELVILVDRSRSSLSTAEGVDGYVKEILEENDDRYSIAIVLFANEQKVALPMGVHSSDEAFAEYLAASQEELDDTATDLSSALLRAWDPTSKEGLIRYPSTSKVLVLSDGLQTDRDALAAVRSLTRDGVRVETAFYGESAQEDSCIVDATFPETEIAEQQTFRLDVQLYSSRKGAAQIGLYDVGEDGEENEMMGEAVEIDRGLQTLSLSYAFPTKGVHHLTLRLEGEDDVPENDVFYTYYDVHESGFMLILEHNEGESTAFAETVRGKVSASHLVIDTMTPEEMGERAAEELVKYSEIVLYNLNASDLTVGQQGALHTYAHEYGGGVFTVGGFEKQGGKVVTAPSKQDPSKEYPVGHSYDKESNGSILSSMLPVTIEDYKPAVAVVFIIDISESMTASGSVKTAVEDARNALSLLEPRDYVGIITLESSAQQQEPLRPMTKEEDIRDRLDEIETMEGNQTKFAAAIRQGITMLGNAPQDVAAKHIVLLSDGGPGDMYSSYSKVVKTGWEKNQISLTVMTYYTGISEKDGSYENRMGGVDQEEMDNLAVLGHGTSAYAPADNTYGHALEPVLREDLQLDVLEDVGHQSYSPRIGAHSDALTVTDTELSELTLQGFFPSRARLDDNVNVLLLAESSPLYAEWTLGAGIVGSILIDLEGVWSEDLLATETGNRLLGEIAAHLFRRVEEPSSAGTLSFTMTEENYRTQVNVYGFDKKSEPSAKIVAMVYTPDPEVPTLKYDVEQLSATRNRFFFENTVPGTYTVYILKVSADLDIMSERYQRVEDLPSEAVLETMRGHRTFSYSAEFDSTRDAFTEGQELLAALSTRTAEGTEPYEKFVYDAEDLFADRGFTTIVADPRLGFFIAALALYLIEIGFRRFKLPAPRRHPTPTT